ncbi:MAG: penicillin-binding transpeptidase domain-containing protein [bacterium]|nr:penicillin-binding transpeptidase domain-containing protein [bacterium]
MNPGFVVLGQRLGTQLLYDYLIKFGFGEKTGVDLNGEAKGIMFSLDKMGPVETATTAFGQGISVTPIQQIRGVSAAVNGGNLYTPYIVRSISESETNEMIVLNEPKMVRKVISEETSSLVRYALESVVANGTGKNAYIENYRVGGKTGTAQKVSNGRYMVGNYILSFIGIFPADKPDYVVYVAVNNPKGVTQYGGTVAAPIAKNVLLSLIDIMGYEATPGDKTREYTWLDEKYKYVPSTIGLDLDTAKKTLKGFKIEYAGSGNTVAYQEPNNRWIKESGIVKLYLEE